MPTDAKQKTNATAIPEVKVNQNNQWDFLFKPQLEGGEPSFAKSLRGARSIIQKILSYAVFLWAALAVLLAIFFALVFGPLKSMLRWIGALFITVGAICFGVIYGVAQFALLFSTDFAIKSNTVILKQIKPLISSIVKDLIDQAFSPLSHQRALCRK